MTAEGPLAQLTRLKNPSRAKRAAQYFQVFPGGYGEGDRFLGLTVPEVRGVLRHYLGSYPGKPRRQWTPATAAELKRYARSPWHEVRLFAFLALASFAERLGPDSPEAWKIAQALMASLKVLNNWDLIDSSVPMVLGPFVEGRLSGKLEGFLKSPSVWKRRIAMMSCQYLIRKGRCETALRFAEALSSDEHPLIHKASGWMLREVGDREPRKLQEYLERAAPRLPRTMLRYAIEHLSPAQRKRYLRMR